MNGAKPQLVIDNAPVRSVPRVPSWMSDDAKAEWRRVVPELVDRRILTKADLASLENYCISIGTTREMERHLQEHGRVVEAFKLNKDGERVSTGMERNPATLIQKEAMTLAKQLASELGLTPVSRSRPAIRDDDDDDSLLD